MLREVVEHDLLVAGGGVFRQRAAPVDEFAVDVRPRERGFAAPEEFAVGDVAAAHAFDFPVPRAEVLIREPEVPRSVLFNGIAGYGVREERHNPQLAYEREHAFPAGHFRPEHAVICADKTHFFS